jgi:hypothetical protein
MQLKSKRIFYEDVKEGDLLTGFPTKNPFLYFVIKKNLKTNKFYYMFIGQPKIICTSGGDTFRQYYRFSYENAE